MDTNGSDSSRQIQVRFVTKLEPPLKAPASSIAVPSYLNRMGLSEIVNSLLKSVSSEFEPQPFDFLVDGELVWMSLEQFLLAKGISAERVLEIEYIKVVAPREQKDPCLHDDWVSAVDGSDPRFILTGCYDNISRIWKVGSLCTHILEGHTGAVTSVSILNTTGVENGNIRLATGSKDRTLRLWMLDVAGKVDYPMKIGAYKVLNGHMASVQSISSAPLGDKALGIALSSCGKLTILKLKVILCR
ncbi:uncharacterized protein A4U43_C03F20730 [Asparagus officinalis]|uniref:NLE domain-containing protein n=1 Tax=Asparagus officinalis TaxID=4686 RepID=A0A5P1FBS2_ASPOF|nr:uncharacterized protein A4U43_C03F20730 [Asparagus officinalis]